MRQRFSALRSREKQGANPQIEQAREKFTPAHKKRALGEDESDEELPTKTSRRRRRRSNVVPKRKSKSNEKVTIDDEDSSSPEPTLRLPIANKTTTPVVSNTTPPVHNTRGAAARSSLTITKLNVNGNSNENQNQSQNQSIVENQSQVENLSQMENLSQDQSECHEQIQCQEKIQSQAQIQAHIQNQMLAPPIENGITTVTCLESQIEKNTTSIVNLTEYQAQPTIRISDSILKIINDENDKKIIIQSSDSE